MHLRQAPRGMSRSLSGDPSPHLDGEPRETCYGSAVSYLPFSLDRR